MKATHIVFFTHWYFQDLLEAFLHLVLVGEGVVAEKQVESSLIVSLKSRDFILEEEGRRNRETGISPVL